MSARLLASRNQLLMAFRGGLVEVNVSLTAIDFFVVKLMVQLVN